MADHPILFSGSMVRAILREIEKPGSGKTQTRRVVKPQPTVHPNGAWSWEGRHGGFVGAAGTHVEEGFPESARYWCRVQPGARLWVREAWAPLSALTHNDPGVQALADNGFYRADGGTVQGDIRRWRPSIHMPRWASRLTLYVTDVRVERLQDISEADAVAEGCTPRRDGWFPIIDEKRGLTGSAPDARSAYAFLWNAINGAGAWEANPWVVAYTFIPRLGNIDTLPATLQEAA